MGWLDKYHAVRTSAEEAVKLVKSGDRVVTGHGWGEPGLLIKALMDRKEELRDVEICHPLAIGEARYCDPEMKGHFRHNALFLGKPTRTAIQEGRGDITPCFLGEIPRLFEPGGSLPVDVTMVQVSKPDEHGFCSFGISVDVTKPAADNSQLVLAEVNEQMPRTHGDAFIHVTKLAAAVEVDHPVLELKRHEINDVTRKIGQNVAELIRDEDCLQMGIGGIPDATLNAVTDRKHLGIHTEMLSNGILELIEMGVVTNERKNLNRGKVVTSFLGGDRKLYDWADNNPFIEMHPCTYTNDPFVVAQNDNMVAINSAVEIDFTGQACSDSIGRKFFSGVGGQVDFIRGAARSKGGRPILAMPSTAKNGTISRICHTLKPGASVTTSRYDIHWVVTEYGAVNLHGLSIRQRVKAMIEIAHPDFREELTEKGIEYRYI